MQIQAPQPEPIFQYFDGLNQVFADPWVLHREIFRRTLGRPNELANRVYAVTPETTDPGILLAGYEAMDALEGMVRELFRMQPFNPLTGQGAQWPHRFAAWEQFATFMSEAKKKMRDDADDGFAFGFPAGFRPSYADWIGLRLNIPRLHLRGAANFLLGVKYARGGQIPFELFDAVALSEEEAQETQLDVNSERLVEELLAEARRS